MTEARQDEPPSLFRPPVFMIGQDRRGNWVVQDQKGIAGGLFATRDAALRYARSEAADQPRAVVMVSGNLELDMSRCTALLADHEWAAGLQPVRRTA